MRSKRKKALGLRRCKHQLHKHMSQSKVFFFFRFHFVMLLFCLFLHSNFGAVSCKLSAMFVSGHALLSVHIYFGKKCDHAKWTANEMRKKNAVALLWNGKSFLRLPLRLKNVPKMYFLEFFFVFVFLFSVFLCHFSQFFLLAMKTQTWQFHMR